MTDSPYKPPDSYVTDRDARRFSIWMTLAAGCAGYGAILVVWMLAMPFWQQAFLANGVALNELNRTLYVDAYFNVYRLMLHAVAGLIAGVLAVRCTEDRPYLHAAVSTLPIYGILLSRYFSVFDNLYPVWSEFGAFVLPIPFALLGARLQLRAFAAKPGMNS